MEVVIVSEEVILNFIGRYSDKNKKKHPLRAKNNILALNLTLFLHLALS